MVDALFADQDDLVATLTMNMHRIALAARRTVGMLFLAAFQIFRSSLLGLAAGKLGGIALSGMLLVIAAVFVEVAVGSMYMAAFLCAIMEGALAGLAAHMALFRTDASVGSNGAYRFSAFRLAANKLIQLIAVQIAGAVCLSMLVIAAVFNAVSMLFIIAGVIIFQIAIQLLLIAMGGICGSLRIIFDMIIKRISVCIHMLSQLAGAVKPGSLLCEYAYTQQAHHHAKCKQHCKHFLQFLCHVLFSFS
jgi:hypothetical protein